MGLCWRIRSRLERDLFMEKSYLDELSELLKWVSPRLASAYKLEFKNVFGAVGGYVDDNIFISYGKFGVALRLPPKILKDLFDKPGVKHLKYFPKGHVKKEYVVLPKRMLEDKKQFKKLVDKSVKYALAL